MVAGKILLLSSFVLALFVCHISCASTGGIRPPAVFFKSGTDAALIAAVSKRIQNLYANSRSRKSNPQGIWTTTASNAIVTQGQPFTLTWSIVPDNTLIDDSLGGPLTPSNLIATMDAIYGSAAQPIANKPWVLIINSVFTAWSGISSVNYVFEANDDGTPLPATPGALGFRGDIRVGGKFIDGNNGELGFAYFPNAGDIVLDTGDSTFSGSNKENFLFGTVLHEHGHSLGLDHVCPTDGTKVMEPLLSTFFSGPQHDDIHGIQFLYGDRIEPNDNAGAATGLGSLVVPSVINYPAANSPISIDRGGKVDYFSFSVQSTSQVSIVVSPAGFIYQHSVPASGSAVCPSSSPYNSNNFLDLTLSLYNQNGANLLSSANSNGIGGSETITQTLNAGQTYYIAVSALGNAASAQLYRLVITLTASAGGSSTTSTSTTSTSTSTTSTTRTSTSTTTTASTTTTPVANPGVCGNGVCEGNLGETCVTCGQDCPVIKSRCGDGVCDINSIFGENCKNCPADCFKGVKSNGQKYCCGLDDFTQKRCGQVIATGPSGSICCGLLTCNINAPKCKKSGKVCSVNLDCCSQKCKSGVCK